MSTHTFSPIYAVSQSSKMSITQTFRLAHQARGKLSHEASRHDHNLRLLVGHANLLDSLMIHLSEAEQEQERWFNDTVRANHDDEEEFGSLPADYDSDSEDEEDIYEEEVEQAKSVYRLPYSEKTVVKVSEIEEEDYDDDEETDEDDLSDSDDYSLHRTTSRRPPSLCSDLSDDEDDEATPSSPPQPLLHDPVFSQKDSLSGNYFEPLEGGMLMDDHRLYVSSRPQALISY